MRPYTFICVRSRELKKAPKDWRKANVTHLFEKEDLGNCRQISLTSISWELMQYVILESISRHMKDEKMVRNCQHRFTKGKSFLINMTSFCNKMTGQKTWQELLDIVYFEFIKAEKLMICGLDR